MHLEHVLTLLKIMLSVDLDIFYFKRCTNN